MRTKKFRIIRMIICGKLKYVLVPPKACNAQLYYEESFSDAVIRMNIVVQRWEAKRALMAELQLNSLYGKFASTVVTHTATYDA